MNFIFSSARSVVVAAVVLICASLMAVSSYAQTSRLGYVIGGPAGVSGWLGPRSSFHVAGGPEFGFGIIGVGGELGYWTTGLVMASVNGSVSPTKRGVGQKAVPFITAGFTTASSFESSFNAWNVGGGTNVWTNNRLGIRVDVRDHIRPDSRGALHYWSIRAGLVFR